MDDHFIEEIGAALEEAKRKEYPDYRNTVYCDVHLGVKMLLATSWQSMEYLDTRVDANTNCLWLCPKPGCDRHYDPTMFGYHVNEPGRRLPTEKRPRGNHPGCPFMYIGKFNQGRRYFCPLYKCHEQGPTVQAVVQDEDVPLPPDPLANLKSAERKRAIEMLVFQGFASPSGLPIDVGSAENHDPNFPDILCTISGQKYWFELGRIINEEVAEKLNPNRRKQESGFTYDQEQPFVDLIKDKAANQNYRLDGAPMDLVMHFDRRFGTEGTVRKLCAKHSTLLKSLTTTGMFKRFWVFDEFDKRVVWKG